MRPPHERLVLLKYRWEHLAENAWFCCTRVLTEISLKTRVAVNVLKYGRKHSSLRGCKWQKHIESYYAGHPVYAAFEYSNSVRIFCGKLHFFLRNYRVEVLCVDPLLSFCHCFLFLFTILRLFREDNIIARRRSDVYILFLFIRTTAFERAFILSSASIAKYRFR